MVALVGAGLMDPDANPIGFGLLGTFGSLIGMAMSAIGLLLTLFRRVR